MMQIGRMDAECSTDGLRFGFRHGMAVPENKFNRIQRETGMARSVNKVTLMGHLGRDPEVRNFQNGGKVCSLRIATSERWRDRDTGEQRERTEWHSISIYVEPLVRLAEQYLRKGSMVYVEGQLETRKWQDQSGQDRYTTEVALRPYRGEIVLLPRGSDGGGGDYADDRGGGYGGYGGAPSGGTGQQPDPGGPPSQASDIDDEIPF